LGATLPYPTQPANGQAPDATPILSNLLALLSAIQGFDGSQILAKTIIENGLADQINPRLRDSGSTAPFIEVGGYSNAFVALGWTMPSGIAWLNGYRSNFTGASYTVAINSDTYYSVTQAGAINTPQAVTNNAAQPALAVGSQWLAKVISGASAITSIQDIRNRSPLNAGSLITTLANTGTAGGTMNYLNLGGLKVLWGKTAQISLTGTGFQATVGLVINWPPSFFTVPPFVLLSLDQVVNTQYLTAVISNVATTTFTAIELVQLNGTNGGAPVNFIAIGT